MHDSTSITTARLDRIERALGDLLANRDLLVETLDAVRDALKTKNGELDRLANIERDLTGIRRTLAAAGLRDTATEQREEVRGLHLVT